MGSVECACKGCPSCDSWVNTRVQGHTYLSCEQPVSKKLCHYGSLCKKCLEQADARANGGGAGGQDGASASGQPPQPIEAQVQCLLTRVEAQQATIEQLQWHVWWLLAQAEVEWWAGESHGPPHGASAAEWQHRLAEALSVTLLISSQELARWALITLTIRCHALTNGGTANKKHQNRYHNHHHHQHACPNMISA